MNTRAQIHAIETLDTTHLAHAAAAHSGMSVCPRAPVGAAALALALATLTAACIAQDPGVPGVEEDIAPEEADLVDVTEQASTCGFPTSCLAIKAAAPPGTVFSDGEYGLYVGGDPSKPWTAYCEGMDGNAPEEYLSLQYTGGSYNFSQHTAGGSAPGTNVRTRYTKLRIDPTTLLVDISDQRFSYSSGTILNGTTVVTSMPVGVAMSCDGFPDGISNIDLRGTPFALVPNQFIQGGDSPLGASLYSSNDQVVALTGGGRCGWTMSQPNVNKPVNNAGGFQLRLSYLGPIL